MGAGYECTYLSSVDILLLTSSFYWTRLIAYSQWNHMPATRLNLLLYLFKNRNSLLLSDLHHSSFLFTRTILKMIGTVICVENPLHPI
jgi:uncharacterized membrane protein